ncbi:MAG: hypothetical protein AAB426_04185 [Myxococcota bacterium]
MRSIGVGMAAAAIAGLMGCTWLGDLGTNSGSNGSGLSGGNPTDAASDSCGGSCDDGNPCTHDTCTSGVCANAPIDDEVLACGDELTLQRCDTGQLTELRCATACVAEGYNAFAGCDPTDVGCPCGWVYASCTPGAVGCVGNTRFIAECEAASDAGTDDNVWHAYDCDAVCADAGYGPAITCAVDLNDLTSSVCYCEDRCLPSCRAGSVCFDGSCYELGSYPPSPGDECAADFECGYQEACDGGLCEPVECKIDSDCGYCEQCNVHYCDSCGTAADGSCSCY